MNADMGRSPSLPHRDQVFLPGAFVFTAITIHICPLFLPTPLPESDAGLHVTISQEMAEHCEWIVPRFREETFPVKSLLYCSRHSDESSHWRDSCRNWVRQLSGHRIDGWLWTCRRTTGELCAPCSGQRTICRMCRPGAFDICLSPDVTGDSVSGRALWNGVAATANVSKSIPRRAGRLTLPLVCGRSERASQCVRHQLRPVSEVLTLGRNAPRSRWISSEGRPGTVAV